jgi:hypothetical protein
VNVHLCKYQKKTSGVIFHLLEQEKILNLVFLVFWNVTFYQLEFLKKSKKVFPISLSASKGIQTLEHKDCSTSYFHCKNILNHCLTNKALFKEPC